MKLICYDSKTSEFTEKEISKAEFDNDKNVWKIKRNLFLTDRKDNEFILTNEAEFVIASYKQLVGLCSEYEGELYYIDGFDGCDIRIKRCRDNHTTNLDTFYGKNFMQNVLECLNFRVLLDIK